MAAIAIQERERLAALHKYQILDTFPEIAFERVTRLTARLLRAPIVLVSFVDRDRVWFKSRHGLHLTETVRENSFCEQTIQTDRVLVIPDIQAEPRYRDYDLLKAEPTLQFYAAAPLVTLDRHRIGTLCVFDVQPRRNFIVEQQRTLADLAAFVIDEMDLRLANRRLAQKEAEVIADDFATAGMTSKVRDRRPTSSDTFALTVLGPQPERHSAKFVERWESGLVLRTESVIPAGSRVLVAFDRTVMLGRVSYSPTSENGYQVGVELEKSVSSATSLERLAEALRNHEKVAQTVAVASA